MMTLKLFTLCSFLCAFSAFADDLSSTAADNVDEVKRAPASVSDNDTAPAGPDYSVPDYIDDPKTIDREPRGAIESMPPRR
jgi:hypothetical protein